MKILNLLTLALLVGVSQSAPAYFTAYGPSVGDATLFRNDDSYTGQVSLIGGMDFFGTERNTVYVNNNGIITLDQPTSQYTPAAFSTITTPTIAAFWADVDTRPSNGGYLYYRSTLDAATVDAASQFVRDTNPGSTFVGTKAFVATWENVGYYSYHVEKLNTFQIVLVADDSHHTYAIFNYGTMQWITGDASGGSGGFGGTAAGVGFAKGDGVNFAQVQGSLTQDVINVGTRSNCNIGGVSQTGRYVFSVSTGVNTNACCTTSLPPTLSGAPATETFNIGSISAVPTFTGTVTAHAECTTPATSTVAPNVFEVFGCPVRRSWSYMDACFKPVSAVQTFVYPEVFSEEFVMTRPADYHMTGTCGGVSAPNPSVSGTATTNRGTNAVVTYQDSAFTVVNGVCSMFRDWRGEDICEVVKNSRQTIFVSATPPPPVTTGAVTTGQLMPPYVTVAEYCATFPIDEGYQAYYCSADHSQYYACMTGAFNSQSAAQGCPATTFCNCAPGVECSQGGTVSPCDFPPSP